MKSFIVIGLLLTCLLFRAESVDSSKYSCDPTNDCEGANPGDKVPDSENCYQYYLCVHGGQNDTTYPSDDPVACPGGQFFDWETGDCLDNGGAACRDLCINFCNITCTEAGDLLADPTGCGNYYFCRSSSDEEKLEASCGNTGPYFDGFQCQNDSTKCCDICTPYCNEQFTETLDPYDCLRYYLCLSEGIPTDTDAHACPSGQHFDSDEGRCTDGVECEPLCSSSSSFLH